MSVQTVYIPHTAGTVLGSHYHQPWVAASAAHAAATPWQGQPAFTDRADAFAWLELARADTFRLLDFAVARIDADTWLDPHGQRRLWVDYPALVDPHRQVVRVDADSPGPNVSTLNALYAGVHEHALHRWESSRRAWTGRDPATDLAHTVWQRTYPIAFYDAAAVLAERVGHAARLLLSDPDPRQDLDHATIAGLSALTHAAAGLANTRLQVPAPAASVVDAAASAARDDRQGGWRYAVDRVWAQALVTAAADGLITAATALTNAWTTRSGGDAPATAAGQAVGAWLRRTLAESHQSVLSEWLQVAGHHPTKPAPAAARAYQQLTTINHDSTVDAPVALPAAPAAVAALPSGRGR